MTKVPAKLKATPTPPPLQKQKRSTTRSSATELLRETHKLSTLGKLAAEIVHEIRNPLTVLSISLEAIKRNAENNNTIQDALGHAIASVERIHKITSVTLDYARTTHVANDVVDIPKLVKETIPLISATLRGKVIHFEIDIDHPPLPVVLGDRGMLQQVLVNLLMNAADSIESRGVVTVKCRMQKTAKGNSMKLEISDTGKGISKADINKIFTQFFSRKPDGTGLGLSITRTILEHHNASIAVHSVLGSGSTFSIVFPSERIVSSIVE